MPQVYSVRFGLLTGAGKNVQFPVPAGKRGVVICCSGSNMVASAGAVYFGIAGNTVWYQPLPGQFSTALFTGRAVAYEGENIALVTTGTSVNAQLSGYLLDDPG